MKTIEMKVGNKLVQFTTKSLVIDGTEYFYSKITDIKHSASKHVYAFTYDGEVKYLPYDPKYEAGLKAIFSKINALHKKPAPAPAPEAPVEPVAEPSPAEEAPAEPVAEAVPAEEAPAEPVAEAPAPVEEAPTAEELAAMADETVFDVPEELKAPQAEAAPAEAAEAPATETAEAAAETKEGAAADSEPSEDSEEVKPEEKKGKLKKSILIFVGIIALICLLSVAYFHFFGTSSNPTTGPNSTESQQYDDIDELIENLDE